MTRQSTVDRVHAAYRRIRGLDRPEIWITLRDEGEVLVESAAIDARLAAGESLPLAGLLAGVKDNIDVAGLPTTAAAPSFLYRPVDDATAVQRLREAGALVIGKTNLDQFATGLVGSRSPYGAVRNAWDPARISGGSSSGSAVAVALGLVDVALGTDTAGSGRVPAALNGVIGWKATRGLIPTTGVVPACRSLDCVTVFARELGLAKRTADLLSGPDGADPLARTTVEREALTPASGSPARSRVAIPTPEHLTGLADGWTEAFRQAVERLRASGVDVMEVDIAPLLQTSRMLYEGAFVAERYAAVGAHIAAHRDLIGTGLDASVAAIILAGAEPSAVELYRDRETLDGLARAADRVLEGCDALLTPTTTWHPTFEDLTVDPIGGNSRLGRFTNFANLLDLTSVAVPAGTVDGLPFGVMFTAAAFHDEGVGQLAQRLLAPALDILVVGAHLSDQPLNHQLVAAGGSLAGPVLTAPEYALFALDTTPAKPGLVRVGAGGASIAGEVWSLPAAGFGAFVAALPQPMTIGRVTLSDGRTVSGFLCETIATDGAEDITGHGGWLSWLGSSRSVL